MINHFINYIMFLQTLEALQHCAQCALLPGKWAWVHWLVCSLLSSFVQLARLKLKDTCVIVWPLESVPESIKLEISLAARNSSLAGWIWPNLTKSDQLAPQWLAFGTLCFLENGIYVTGWMPVLIVECCRPACTSHHSYSSNFCISNMFTISRSQSWPERKRGTGKKWTDYWRLRQS